MIHATYGKDTLHTPRSCTGDRDWERLREPEMSPKSSAHPRRVPRG